MTWINPDDLSLQIQSLDEARFVALCNSILMQAAAGGSIPRSCLAINLKTKEPDGGIDARCENAPATVGRLIPRANVAYQFKSGHAAKSIQKIVDDDILAHARVVEKLRTGYAFVYITAWDRGDRAEEDIIVAARAAGLQLSEDQVKFFGRESLAHELVRFPGAIANFLHIDDAALSGFDAWAAFPSLSNPFQADSTVVSQIDDLNRQLSAPRSAVRIFGAAGDGKTRLVLEALRDSELRESVVYAAQQDQIHPSIIAHLLRTRDSSCTLVVDEVDDAGAERLMDRLGARPDGVRMVLIGVDASGRTASDSLQVPGLSEDLLVATIRAIVPALDVTVATNIARDCERSPKLAVLIARRILEDPELALPNMLADGEVRNALDRYLPIKVNEPDWMALSCACLLMRIGWKDELEPESTRVFSGLGQDPAIARRHVEELHAKFGIAPLGGRYRYISPAILADHLAARQLQTWPREKLAAFFRLLSPEMAESFSLRARRLAEVLSNRAIVEEVILGDQGPFRNFDDVESGGISFVLRHLAAPFPHSTLRALERCVGAEPMATLRSAKNSRRDLVWALQDLLWPADIFERASQLLLELAIAENETWANNASGVWVETFQTLLGRTAAGGPARVRAVQRAAQHESAVARILASRAVKSAFRSGHVSRAGNPPADVKNMPRHEWRPATYGELFDSLVGYLNILRGLVKDSEPSVRETALEALGDLAMEMPNMGDRVAERWQSIASELTLSSPKERRPVLTGIDAAMRRWGRWLESGNASGEQIGRDAESQEQSHQMTVENRLAMLRAVLEALDGGDVFGSHLRAALDAVIRGEVYPSEGQHSALETLRVLAVSAVNEPQKMGAHWDWLLADKEWSRAERWIEFLGAADSNRVFDPTFKALAQGHARALGWRSLYDLAFAGTIDDDGWAARRANSLVEEGDTAQAFDLLKRGAYAADRYAVLVRLVRDGGVPASRIADLAYSPWVVGLPTAQLKELLAAANGASREALRTLVSAFLQHHPGEIEALRSECLEFLGTDASEDLRTSAVYDWAFLAGKLVVSAPTEVARLALDRIGKQEVAHDVGLNQILRAAWDHGDATSFFDELIVPSLTSNTGAAWWQRKAIAELPVSEISPAYILKWVEGDPERRARAIAEILGPPVGRPSELHAVLLERFGSLGVAIEFYTQFMSGTFMGNESSWLRGKLSAAERWASDDRPTIRDWGSQLLPSLKERIRRAEVEEAEERFL